MLRAQENLSTHPSRSTPPLADSMPPGLLFLGPNPPFSYLAITLARSPAAVPETCLRDLPLPSPYLRGLILVFNKISIMLNTNNGGRLSSDTPATDLHKMKLNPPLHHRPTTASFPPPSLPQMRSSDNTMRHNQKSPTKRDQPKLKTHQGKPVLEREKTNQLQIEKLYL